MSKEKTWQLISKKLAGEASISELAELEELLRNDPDLHYALENVTDIWNLPPQLLGEAEQAFTRHTDRLKTSVLDWNVDENEIQSVRSKKKWYVLSTALIFILAVFFYFYQSNSTKNTKTELAHQQNQPNEISTRYGSRTTKITLPDGSTVWLNSGSNLMYDKNFGNGTREVSLKGEAFFDVNHDANHPFIIHTKEVDIKVLGTAFNVKSYPSEHKTETSLIRGSIEVTTKDSPDRKIMLRPDEKLVVSEEPTKTIAPKSAKNIAQQLHVSRDSVTHYERAENIIVETAWVQEKLVFSDEPFKNIAQNMQRWYNVEVQFLDPGKEELRFTGNFENETIQQALEVLSINHEFSFSIAGNKVFIKK